MNDQGRTLPEQERQEPPIRLPFASRLPDTLRNNFVAMSGEFIGTFFFLFFALSATQVANTTGAQRSSSSSADELVRLLYISLAFGLSLAVNAWVWFRVSGGLFNPAVCFSSGDVVRDELMRSSSFR